MNKNNDLIGGFREEWLGVVVVAVPFAIKVVKMGIKPSQQKKMIKTGSNVYKKTCFY